MEVTAHHTFIDSLQANKLSIGKMITEKTSDGKTVESIEG